MSTSTIGMTEEEIWAEAARESHSHIRALRIHLRQAINQCILFDRVMTGAQRAELDPMLADKLADIRLSVEAGRKALEEQDAAVDVAEGWMHLAMGEDVDEAIGAWNSE